MFSFQSKIRLSQKDLDICSLRFSKKILENRSENEEEIEDHVCKLNGLAQELNDRFSDMTALKPSSDLKKKSLSSSHNEKWRAHFKTNCG